jgi:hypothetical protein
MTNQAATPFATPMDEAWKSYRKILKTEGLNPEEMSIAQQSFKDGWAECERQAKGQRL